MSLLPPVLAPRDISLRDKVGSTAWPRSFDFRDSLRRWDQAWVESTSLGTGRPGFMPLCGLLRVPELAALACPSSLLSAKRRGNRLNPQRKRPA